MFFIIITLQNNSAAYLIIVSLGLTAAEIIVLSDQHAIYFCFSSSPSNSSSLFFTPQSEYLLARIKDCLV